MRGRLPLCLVAVVLLAGCTQVDGSPVTQVVQRQRPVPVPQPVELRTASERGSPGVVAAGGLPAPYNYGPSVLAEDGRYRAWWCSQLPGVGPAGDDVLHASAASPDGPFAEGAAPAVPVFAGEPGRFDGMHTCDPSVLHVGDRYYLYYTGAAGDHAHGNAIGVATSADGMAWRRGAAPIVTAAGEVPRGNVYGAGQPSAVFVDGWFYLLFTDTTAKGAGWNGAGQFVLRSRDPLFAKDVQALTERGFRPAGGERGRSVVDAFSADWAYSPTLDAFAIAHQTTGGTQITFWDREFTRHPYEPVTIPGPWQEGPGIVRDGEGRIRPSTSDPCETVPVDVLRATALAPAPTDIRHFGIDITGADGCGTPARAARALDGVAVPSPVRTVDLVHDGARVRLERRSVAETVAVTVLDDRPDPVDELPVVAEIASGAPALRSPTGEVGVLDTRGGLWRVTPETARANASPVADVTEAQWRSHPARGDLRP
ncbi:beta-xylosidase [Saccharopolyspora endophytica]|uniref:beta-xylosidase n=1 Tax=Saccharopolyspora endophytica TaxID=543886 RepID=UPI0027DAD358|nr:beta-xylosidase [Saccharopolyspora endophytica]